MPQWQQLRVLSRHRAASLNSSRAKAELEIPYSAPSAHPSRPAQLAPGHYTGYQQASSCTPHSPLPSHAGGEGAEGPKVWPALEQVSALTQAQAQAIDTSNIHLEISTKGFSALSPSLAISAFHFHSILGSGIRCTWLQRLHRFCVECGQLWNSTARGGRCDAGAQVSTVHEICSNAGQVWQVGWHIDLGDLAQIWHIEVIFSYLKEMRSRKDKAVTTHLLSLIANRGTAGNSSQSWACVP